MSQKDGVTETIGESKYVMYMLPPIQSHNLLMDVVKMVGPAIGDAVGAIFDGKPADKEIDILNMDVPGELISGALTKLFDGVNKKTLEQMISAFRGMTHVDDAPLDKTFDNHFRGELDMMYKWLFWGMKVQWGKSFSALASGASGRGAGAGLGSLFKSPTTSTGSSGE